ncbi:transketolase family protein, partial [Candidatus Peregrinibacteria bacterium]|nr:transketolase family protein [Candidatus Peregrinibacteria bacterium]
VREGKDITIIAYGASVGNSLIAAKKLSQEGIEATVIDMAFIKPIDKNAIIKAANETGRILTVEESTIIGGLGSAVAEVLAEANATVVFKRLGIPDQYTLAGSYDALQRHYNLDPDGIATESRALFK